MDSLTDEDLMPEGDAVADATDMGDLERLLDLFENARALGLAKMSYEDFLRSNGIAVPNKDEAKPELLARFSDFQYPSNFIGTSGADNNGKNVVGGNNVTVSVERGGRRILKKKST